MPLKSRRFPRLSRRLLRGTAVDAARGVALFVGLFTLLNLLGDLARPGYDANLWWIDLRRLPAAMALPLTWAAAIVMLGFASWPAMRPVRRWGTIGTLAVLLTIATGNAAVFVRLLGRGVIDAGFPLPFSLLVMAGLGVMLTGVIIANRSADEAAACGAPHDPALDSPHGPPRHRWLRRAVVLAVAAACAVAFPLMQMLCFGHTDYRRPADAAVVFGARAYANGAPSQALADRVRTACDLYHAGLTRRLVFSGGPGDGDIHETEAMRRYAVRLGVPDNAIVCDPAGINTRATVDNTVPLLHDLHLRRVIAVSHFYHLPRIKLAYQQAGLDVYTVPAREAYPLTQLPYNMGREVVALWWYYAGPLLG